jgi:hypothetical protein
MATGGTVMGPTLALIGEAGPERVIPLNRSDAQSGGTVQINMTVQGRQPTQSEWDEMWANLVRSGKRAGVRFAGA